MTHILSFVSYVTPLQSFLLHNHLSKSYGTLCHLTTDGLLNLHTMSKANFFFHTRCLAGWSASKIYWLIAWFCLLPIWTKYCHKIMKLFSGYSTSHQYVKSITSKIMLRVILNRLKKEAEEHLAEEQAGFRPGRSTVEQIFNCHIMMEKHLQHQKELFHNFIDFKKAFDRVWHEGLWHIMRSFGIEEGLIQIIQALYNTASSAVLLNSDIGEFFKTTVGDR